MEDLPPGISQLSAIGTKRTLFCQTSGNKAFPDDPEKYRPVYRRIFEIGKDAQHTDQSISKVIPKAITVSTMPIMKML